MNPSSIIGSHIFVVEDDLIMQFLYKRMFSRSCTLTVFNNGAEAFSAMQNGMIPDLIITDMNVPVMNGTELLAKVKGSEELSHVPMMIVSGDHSPEMQCRSLLNGASDYVMKPFDIPELTARVAMAIQSASIKPERMLA